MARKGNNISLTRSTKEGIQEKASKHQNAETSNLQNVKPLKATLYFSPEVTQRLDEAQISLKQLTGLRGHALSRSAIVESALIMALDNLERDEENSSLVSLLLNR